MKFLDREVYKQHMLYMIPFYFGMMAGKTESVLNMIILMALGTLVVLKVKGISDET